ncbi:MAG: hypothetical protein JSS12_10640 [Verrucomicrobia bacterium]|nr:hypothetical protein [Verrucomicrobiota bacterium]
MNRNLTKQPETQIVDIEFDQGLGKGYRMFSLVENSTSDQNRYRILKKVWQRNRPQFAQAASSTKIPKIIHQIWLGPKRPPGFFLKFRESWQKLHPDWEYRLWTDADLATYDFELRDLFDLSENYGEKSDILRCEVLLKYGGVYVDADFECLKPLDELAAKYDFFAGIEPPHEIPESSRVLFVSNAIIGAVPGHPVLKRWKTVIRDRWQKAETECFSTIEKVLVRTFLSFGRAVEERLDSPEHVNIVFPSTYFFPIRPEHIRKPVEPPNIAKRLLIAFDLCKDHPFSRPMPESLAIHHFAATWQKGSTEMIKEVQREVMKLRREQAELAKELEQLKKKEAA